jgi:hypothetical protein
MKKSKLNSVNCHPELVEGFYLILTSLIIFTISSCQNSTQPIAQKTYFDVPAFISEQITQLQNDSMIVIKTAEVNETTDQHQIDWTDWNRELTLFKNSDINKSAFIGKYLVDTLTVDSNKKQIRYAATDSSLNTRLIEVTLNTKQNSVTELHIINITKDFISSTHEDLLFIPNKAYVIRSSQSMMFFGTNDLKVMGQITSKEKKYF